MRAAPSAKYAQAIRNDATTRSFNAVGVCSITTVNVEKASAAKTAARRSNPRRRATPTIAMQAKANATSWTRPTKRSPPLRIIVAAVSISALGGNTLTATSFTFATYETACCCFQSALRGRW